MTLQARVGAARQKCCGDAMLISESKIHIILDFPYYLLIVLTFNSDPLSVFAKARSHSAYPDTHTGTLEPTGQFAPPLPRLVGYYPAARKYSGPSGPDLAQQIEAQNRMQSSFPLTAML
jgi:hypothetical protein